jgi:hypothetical protein
VGSRAVGAADLADLLAARGLADVWGSLHGGRPTTATDAYTRLARTASGRVTGARLDYVMAPSTLLAGGWVRSCSHRWDRMWRLGTMLLLNCACRRHSTPQGVPGDGFFRHNCCGMRPLFSWPLRTLGRWLQRGSPPQKRKKERKEWHTSLSPKAMGPRAAAGGRCAVKGTTRGYTWDTTKHHPAPQEARG